MTALWRLNSCHLRAAYDCDKAVSTRLRRGSLFSALGNTAHALEEAVHQGEFEGEDDSRLNAKIDAYWNNTLLKELGLLQAQWTEYQVPRVRDLPRYATVYCNATERAAEIVRSSRSTTRSQITAHVEQTLIDEERLILGRPDRYVIDGDSFSVIDIKSGVVDSEIAPAHRHQLLTYCHLIEQETGLIPNSIAIQDIEGRQVRENVSSEQVAKHIAEILESRSHFLERVKRAGGWQDAATPSRDTCQFCDYRVICPAYWNQPSEEIQDNDFKGTVVSVPMPRVFTVSSDAQRVDQPAIVSVSGYEKPVALGAAVAVTGGWLVGSMLRASIGTSVFEITQQQ